LHLSYGNIFVECEGKSSEINVLRNILTFPDGKENTECLLTEDLLGGHIFLSGLFNIVRKNLDEMEIPYTVSGAPLLNDLDSIQVDDDILEGITLRPHQNRAVFKSLYNKRGIVYLPTASGKTAVAGALTKTFDENKTLLVVPGVNSLKQTYQSFKEKGIDNIGRIGDEFSETDSQHTIAVVNSLYRRIQNCDESIQKILSEAKLLQLMEAHHTPANMWSTVARNCFSEYRIALSATPFSQPDTPISYRDHLLVGATGDVIAYTPEYLLMDQGFLSSPHVITVDMTGPFLKHTNWQIIKSKCITKNDVRNEAICHIATSLCDENHKVMTLVNETTHGDLLCKMMSKGRIEPIYMFFGGSKLSTYKNGNKVGTQTIPIDKLSKDLLRKDSYCLVGSPAVHEDADFPDVDTLIVAGAGRSFQHTVQSAGRALRGSSRVWVIDFMDKTGFVMLSQSKARLKWYVDRYSKAKRFVLSQVENADEAIQLVLNDT
jgi:superfamily II DNA or RNA helicase